MLVDAELGIALTEEQAAGFAAEAKRMMRLRAGLDHLYRFVRRVEIQVGLRERFSHMFTLEAAELRDIPEEAALCAIEWYTGCIREHCELVAGIGKGVAPEVTDWQSYGQKLCETVPDLADRDQLGDLRLTVGGRRLVVCCNPDAQPWSLTAFHEGIAGRYGLRLVGL